MALRFVVFAVMMAASPCHALAQPQTAANAGDQAAPETHGETHIDPATLAAARRVIVASHAEQLFLHTIELVMPAITRPIAQAQGLTEAQAQVVERVVVEEMEADPSPVIDFMANTYARHLSAEDLEVLADYYKSPSGQRMLAALPQMQTEMSALGQQWARQVLAPRIVRRIENLVAPSAPGHS